MLKVWLLYFRNETLKIHDFPHIHASEVKIITILPIKHIFCKKKKTDNSALGIGLVFGILLIGFSFR